MKQKEIRKDSLRYRCCQFCDRLWLNRGIEKTFGDLFLATKRKSGKNNCLWSKATREKEETMDESKTCFMTHYLIKFDSKAPKNNSFRLRGFLLTLPTFWDDPHMYLCFGWILKSFMVGAEIYSRPDAINENSTGNISINTSKGDSFEEGKSFTIHFLTFLLPLYCVKRRGKSLNVNDYFIIVS